MRTHCPYCALQCAMRVEPQAGGAYAARGDATFDVNAATLCVKGFTAGETLSHPERLLTPLVRRGGRLEPASWDEALQTVAERFTSIAQRHGTSITAASACRPRRPRRSARLGSTAVCRFRSIGSSVPRFCCSRAATRAIRCRRSRAGWMAGAKTARRSIVIDPRRTTFAAGATLHLQPPPGSDVVLAHALLHVLIAERRVDEAYVASRTRGFDAVRWRAEREDPERVERLTGVPADDIRRAARVLADAPSAIVLTGRGVEQQRDGSDAANAYINLALACGLPGRPYSGYGTLTGQANGQGGREHGQKSDQLPGYRDARDPAARAAVARAWNVAPADLGMPGLSASEIFGATGDAIRGLFIMASNPVVTAPNTAAVRERFARAEFICVCDFFPSETTQFAHVVLPALQYAEEAGTMTNLEGRLLLRERVVSPPPGPRSDLAILMDSPRDWAAPISS